jgi:hypothetical protein
MKAFQIKGGDIVAYRKPFADGIDERHERMVVLEDREDRVVVQSLYCYSCKRILKECKCNVIQPTQCLAKVHLVNAMEESE